MVKCKICGKEFSRNSALGTHINRTHHQTTKEYYDCYIGQLGDGKCIVCGKETTFINLTEGYHKYCSLNCYTENNILNMTKSIDKDEFTIYYTSHSDSKVIEHYNINQTSLRYLLDKYNMVQHNKSENSELTSLQNYGVKHPSMNADVQKNIFDAKLEKYGDPYYNNCEKQTQTCLEKYGVSNVFQTDWCKQKAIETKINRYGNQNYTNREQADKTKFERYGSTGYNNREKAKVTTMERYGVDVYGGSDEQLKKAEITIKNKYGSKKNFYNHIVESTQCTKLERYGNKTYTNPEKMKQTKLERYGEEAYTNPEKSKQTCMKRYGVSSYSKTDMFKINAHNRVTEYISKFEEENDCLSLIKLIDRYGQSWYTNKVVPVFYDEKYHYAFIANADIETIERWIDYHPKEPSSLEKSIMEEIKQFYSGTIIKDREILKPKEIDIYLPDVNIGIECNGNYWHSTLHQPDKYYHFEKSYKAQEQNIRLIHIYEYEWNDLDMREKIISLLKIATGNTPSKIYARNCSIQKISNSEAMVLSNKVHLQGHRNASVTYGLFYNNELVQLMSFSKTANAKRNGAEWEIIRGCPGSNNIVVGGVSKLFSHFVKDYNPKSVFSYCDFNKFDGKSYESLGMEFIGYTGPDKSWLLKDHSVVKRNPHKYAELKANSVGIIWGAGSLKYLWKNTKENNMEET